MEQLELLAGKILDGRYALHAVIGRGSSAVVFRGEDTLLQRPVAVKMLRSEALFSSDPGTEDEARKINRYAFWRESLTAAMFSHPHIVAIYDICPETDNPYIVMELIEGVSLADRIASLGILPYHELLYITRCMLEALIEAHEHGVIHRDIKAQNVLLTANGEVKMTDFGIAEVAGRSSLSFSGKVLGTADTMSPEQAGGQKVDERSDLYSLGVLMYQMATGYLPFEADDPQTIVYMHRTEVPKWPSTFRPDIPRGLEQIILTALEKDPKKRFSSAATMLAAIRIAEERPRHIFKSKLRKRTLLSRRIAAKTACLPLGIGSFASALLFVSLFLFCGLFSGDKATVIELPAFANQVYISEEALGLDPRITIEVQYIRRDDLAEGKIIAQFPAAGSCWKLDDEADRQTLWLSVATRDAERSLG